MTTSATPAAPRADRVETFLDWFRIKSRYIAIGAIAVAAALAVWWVVARERTNKQANADRQLQVARQSLLQGNAPLAATDLQKVVTRYGNTPAGIESAMLLAQIHYDKGEYQQGLDVLKQVSGKADEPVAKAAVESLRGDGYAQLNKFEDAAKAYQAAADAAEFPGQKALYLAARARALMAGNKTDEARKAWEELATKPEYAVVAGEARVRLGELTAKPEGRS